jgi:very-short-patch-repair endonuclease
VDRLPRGRRRRGGLVYRDEHLIVETDGRDPHTIHKAFGADRRRDARLMLLGWRVVRFTWQQVVGEPAYVATTLRGLLAD